MGKQKSKNAKSEDVLKGMRIKASKVKYYGQWMRKQKRKKAKLEDASKDITIKTSNVK